MEDINADHTQGEKDKRRIIILEHGDLEIDEYESKIIYAGSKQQLSFVWRSLFGVCRV